MLHRHLNHDGLTLAAIDDLIARGGRADWERLRKALLADASVSEKIRQVCQVHIQDPYAQRHHFWMNYVNERFEQKAHLEAPGEAG
jgi:hypothetical protein